MFLEDRYYIAKSQDITGHWPRQDGCQKGGHLVAARTAFCIVVEANG